MQKLIVLILLVLISACQQEQETKTSLIWDGVWEVTDVAGVSVLKSTPWLEEESITFISLEQSDGDIIKLNGYSGCNSFGRTIKPNQPKTEKYVMATERGCGKQMAVQESNLFTILSGDPLFSINGDTMAMKVVAENGQTLNGKYIREVRPSLIGKWKVIKINGVPLQEANNLPKILMDIKEDVIEALSGCVSFGWKYKVKEESFLTSKTLLLDKKGNPKAMCTRGLIQPEQFFVDILNEATVYQFNHKGNPIISSQTGSITLKKQ